MSVFLRPYVITRPHCTPGQAVVMAKSKADALNVAVHYWGYVADARARLMRKNDCMPPRHYS
jgi:hypothetical protein